MPSPWVPKVGEAVLFKADGQDDFTDSEVIKVIPGKDGEPTKVTTKTSYANAEFREHEDDFPSDKI